MESCEAPTNYLTVLSNIIETGNRARKASRTEYFDRGTLKKNREFLLLVEALFLWLTFRQLSVCKETQIARSICQFILFRVLLGWKIEAVNSLLTLISW